MKIIKLDGRHKYRRENNMQYAIVSDGYNWQTSKYERWLMETVGSRYNVDDWIGGFPNYYSSHKYYIAVKDPAILTMMALTFTELVDI